MLNNFNCSACSVLMRSQYEKYIKRYLVIILGKIYRNEWSVYRYIPVNHYFMTHLVHYYYYYTVIHFMID